MCGVMLRSIETVILHLQVLVVKDVWEESSPLEKVRGRKCPHGSKTLLTGYSRGRSQLLLMVLWLVVHAQLQTSLGVTRHEFSQNQLHWKQSIFSKT